MNWRHNSGFPVHNVVCIGANDAKGRLGLAQYIISNPFSLEKPRYHPETGMVIYRSAMTQGKARQNFLAVSATEFIGRIVQHIPHKGFQMVGYYGWYSHRSRGKRAKAAQEDPAATQAADATEPRSSISVNTGQAVFLLPPGASVSSGLGRLPPDQTCPRSRSVVKIISFITGAKVVRHSLEHLGKWRE